MKDILIVFLVFILVYIWFVYAEDKVAVQQHFHYEDRTKEWMDDYIKRWQKKEPADSLMRFYNENSILIDLLEDCVLAKGTAIRQQLPWGNSVVIRKNKPAVEITQTIVQPQTIMISGKLAALQRGALVIDEPIPFLTWVKFDTSGFIIEQVWWQKTGN